MKLTASGGTDIASMVICWPALVSQDARDKWKDDPTEVVEQLKAAGGLIEFPCDADGHYSVSVFIDENPPQEFARFAQEEQAGMQVRAKGPAFFDGAEAILPESGSADERNAESLPSHLAIPEGTYSATVFRLEVPEEHELEYLQARFDSATLRKWNRQGTLGALSILTVVAAVVAVFLASWPVWIGLSAIAAGVIVLTSRLGKSPELNAVRAAQKRYEADYPCYVAVLKTI